MNFSTYKGFLRLSNTIMLMLRQERRASRDSEKGREGEVNREEEDRKGVKKEDGEEEKIV